MGVSAPVSLLTRYEARRLDVELAAKRKWPSGSRLKALGTASVAMCPMAVNRPEATSMGSMDVNQLSVYRWLSHFARL
jgi:hypothetical protein